MKLRHLKPLKLPLNVLACPQSAIKWEPWLFVLSDLLDLLLCFLS